MIMCLHFFWALFFWSFIKPRPATVTLDQITLSTFIINHITLHSLMSWTQLEGLHKGLNIANSMLVGICSESLLKEVFYIGKHCEISSSWPTHVIELLSWHNTVNVLFPFSVMDKQEPIFALLGVGSGRLENLLLHFKLFQAVIDNTWCRGFGKDHGFPWIRVWGPRLFHPLQLD